MSLIRVIGPVALAAATFGLFDCQKKVVLIQYSQELNCLKFETDPGNTSSKKTNAHPGKVFMVYKIHSIRNNDPGAADFNFVLSKVFAGNNQQQVPQELDAWAGAQDAPESQTIPKGTWPAPNWRLIIEVAPENPNQLETATEALRYSQLPGESVLMSNVNKDGKPNQPPKFANPCNPGSFP